MEMALITSKQTIIMALYMAAGWVLFKSGKITKEGSKSLATLLVWLVAPCVLVRSFCVAYSAEKLVMLVWSFVLSGIALVISIFLAWLLLRKNPIECFSVAFANTGFFGIPMVTAVLGFEAVFYLAGLLTWFNLMQWTWGVAVLCQKKMTISPKQLMTNPYLIASVLGLVLFVTGLGTQLPIIVKETMDGIAALNAPVAMMILGVYLAQTKLSELFTTPRLYLVSVLRMWFVPAVTLLVFWFVPVDATVRLAILIAAAAPVGANVAVYAQLFGADYPHACQAVASSTALAIAMFPVFVLAAGTLLGM